MLGLLSSHAPDHDVSSLITLPSLKDLLLPGDVIPAVKDDQVSLLLPAEILIPAGLLQTFGYSCLQALVQDFQKRFNNAPYLLFLQLVRQLVQMGLPPGDQVFLGLIHHVLILIQLSFL